MKKILSGVLALIVVVGAANAVLPQDITGLSVTASAASTTDDGLWEYEINSSDTTTIKLLSYKGSEKDVKIPEKITAGIVARNVTVISGDVFRYSMPETVETITIPKTVTQITDDNYNKFWTIKALKSITVESGNPVYASKDGVLYKKNEETGKNETLMCFPRAKTGSFTVPEEVTKLSEGAFCCSQLTSVKLSSGITELPYETFYESTVSSVDIPAKVTKFGGSAFIRCENLKTVTIPDGVTELGDSAFSGCTALESIKIPDSVTYVGKSCFRSCTSLTSVRLSPNCKGLVSSNISNPYDEVFYGCSALKKILIPEGVTELGGGAFKYCSSLETIAIPHSMVWLYNYVGVSGYKPFIGCDNLMLIYYNGTEEELLSALGGKITNHFSSEVYPVYKRNFKDVNKTGVIVSDGVGALPGYDESAESCTITVTTKAITGGTRYTINATNLDKAAFPMATDGTTVTVKIPVPTAYKNKTLSVTSGGKAVDSEVVDGYVVFETNKLGAFDLMASDKVTVDVSVKAPNGVDTSGQKVTVTGNGVNKEIDLANGQLDLAGIGDGKYTFTFSAKNCAPRDYSVTVKSGAVTDLSTAELHLLGDINGDGVVNTQDVAKANAHVKGTSLLKGYDLACINVNKDQNINVQDVALMNAHAKNTKLIW